MYKEINYVVAKSNISAVGCPMVLRVSVRDQKSDDGEVVSKEEKGN
jgi:hypothetical protein